MTESMRDQYIYKVLTLDQWGEFQSSQLFTGSPVDVEDGYIHLSCLSQLKVTLDKWYSDLPTVAILEVQANKVQANLKYEVSRGGAEFPHLFANLPMSAICQQWLVSPENGVYSLPSDLRPDSKAI